jgi:hypothetical protein
LVVVAAGFVAVPVSAPHTAPIAPTAIKPAHTYFNINDTPYCNI